jgi:DUF4097 and DUF4098 domain-containing protein YvlB
MSWIFTIVFSGMLISTYHGSNTAETSPVAVPETQNVVVKVDETERFEQTYLLNANGRVSVSNVNGSITAEGWDRNEIKLIAIKTADSKERLNEVEIKIDSKPDSFSVETKFDNTKTNKGDRWRNGSKLQVDYQLMVPRGAVLSEIETVNGSVTLSDFTNITKASAVNGTVKASNLRGTSDLSTVNGEVDAEYKTLDQSSKVSLGTVNGKATLMIPSDSNATIKVDSLNGNISNDFGLPVRKGKYVGRDMYGRLGSGEVKIKLNSVNGDLKILRQNDGKNLSPATDLLPQKEKDDEDWDGEADALKAVVIAGTKIENARGSAAKALKRAQKEMLKVQPEIERAVSVSVKDAAELIRSEDVQNAIKDGLKQQAVVLARISDAGFFPSMPRVERKSDSIAVKGVPAVKVESRGCAIKITGWDRSEVKYSVTQLTTSRDRSPIDINESHDDSGVTLNIKADSENDRTRIEIFVPKRSNLTIKTDGEIRLDGVSGEINLTGQDGAINVRDADGKLNVASTEGRIRVIGFKGEIETRTNDGMTTIEGDLTRVNATAGNGEIVLTLADDAAATIVSRSPETKVEGLPAVLIKENNENREYRLGSGAAAFTLSTDGQIVLRSSGLLKEVI